MRREFQADALLAVLCAAVTILGVVVTTGPRDDYRLDTAGVLLILGQTLPVAWRRQHPVVAWFVTGVAITVYGVGHFPDTVLDVGPLLVIYTVAAVTSRRTANVVGIITALTIVMALWSAGDADARDVSFNVLVYSLAWIIGENQRSRRAQAQRDAERAVTDERNRIASELHDVVAHHVSTMVVQAEGGASVVRTDPDRAAQAFDAIGTAGRDALTEMRRVVGVLAGESGDGAATAPQPGLDDVDRLVDRVRQCGIDVDVVREGRARPLPSGLDRSAYRIVQEALTNTVRHAEAAHATVVVRYLDEWLELEVADDGRGEGDGEGGGHGLVGMRERVALFGGELRAGPRDGGGFAVVARLRT